MSIEYIFWEVISLFGLHEVYGYVCVCKSKSERQRKFLLVYATIENKFQEVPNNS